ncbi:MAG: 6-phosphogluconolactonase [Cyanobacteria bacterium SZAS-4]|nr:6-phosphogluconolactonase [Cyanobacteria bacterium SZAS-4]
MINSSRIVGKVEVSETATDLVEHIAKTFSELAAKAIKENGRFIVSVSGGSTPKALYERLAQPPYVGGIKWADVIFFLGDERCVPHDHPDSNFKMIDEALLSKIAIPESNVFRTVGQAEDPEVSALSYDEDLRRVFRVGAGDIPRFDLILLGLGPDGHTASLFPESKALKITDRLYVANFVEKFNSHRITMTFPLIDEGQVIIFLVSGDGKAEILKEVLEQPDKQFPSQSIKPRSGNLFWYVDRAAVRLLNPQVYEG